MTNFNFDIHSTLPEIYLVASIFLILVYGVLLSASQAWGYPLLLSSTGILSAQILFFTGLLVWFFPYVNFFAWNYFLVSNFYILSLKILIIAFCFSWFCFSSHYLQREKINSFEYWILILLSVSASFFILHSCDLLSIYLTIELQSLSFYVLASFKRSSEFSTEAGLKYFILGAFSSALLLLGFSLIYGLTGITHVSDFTTLFSGFLFEDSSLILGIFAGLVFIAAALFFKISSAPFHMWSPDVYEGSPTSVTAFFSIFPKLVILTLLIRIFPLSFSDFQEYWKPIFFFCSFLSLLFGSLGALTQKKWKRFLAYSSINHIGFMLLGFLSEGNFGVVSILTYILIYVITTIAIFSFLIDFHFFEYPRKVQTRYIHSITNLSKNDPLLSVFLSILLFSMAGIPPLSGFFAKVFVIFSGIQGGYYSLVFFSVLMSGISCFYYIRIIQLMYFKKIKNQQRLLIIPVSKINGLILSISCFLIFFFFLDIELFSILITRLTLSFLL